MARLKFATYNINGIRARLGALLEWLEREQPDIVCLQELKAPDEAFPSADLEARGYGAIWHGQKSWNGVALLARGTAPVERRRGLPRDPDPSQSRYLEAEVHGLVVGALYLPNGNPWPGPKFDYKLAWFERLIAHARTLLDEGRPVVLAGDFNVVPTDELDIYDPKSWRKDALLQPETREAWFRLLEQGWTDALRAVHDDAKIFTFWDYFRRHWERDAGLRIDHLLLDPQLAPMLRDAGVDRWVRGQPGASDHAPTWVVLDTAGAGRARTRAASMAPGARDPAARAPRTRRAAGGSSEDGSPATLAGRSPRKTTAKTAASSRRSGGAGKGRIPAASSKRPVGAAGSDVARPSPKKPGSARRGAATKPPATVKDTAPTPATAKRKRSGKRASLRAGTAASKSADAPRRDPEPSRSPSSAEWTTRKQRPT